MKNENKNITVLTPGLLQKMSKNCNSPGIFSGLVVFLTYFFENLEKYGKMKESGSNSPGVTPSEYSKVLK